MHHCTKISRILCVFFILLLWANFSPSPLFADTPETEIAENEELTEEQPTEYGRNFPMALTQGFISNLFVWSWNYLGQQPHARISPNSWKRNIETGTEWDRSDFFTNQILHSYEGSPYYTAARSYGFTYWESLLFTAFGSFQWEFFFERDIPSSNDLIVTTMGGAAFGEAGYRLAIAFSNTDEGGARGFLRNFAALIINPTYMLNKAIFGDDFVKRNKLPWTPIDLRLRTGAAYVIDDDERFSGYPHAYFGCTINYGDPWNDQNLYGPYELFNVKVDAEIDLVNPSWDIFADAILCGFKLFPGNRGRIILGLYQQFDYLENLMTHKLAANGGGAGTQVYMPFMEKSSITLNAHFYGLAMAIVDSRATRWEFNRDVGFGDDSKGVGWSCKLGLLYNCGDYFIVSLTYHHYWIDAFHGSDKKNTVDIFMSNLEIPITEVTRFGLEARGYKRWSDIEINRSWSWSFKTYVSFKL